jgi:hypothetical protein
VIENADHSLDADTAMQLILGLIPESERARVEAIADGDQVLMCIGLGLSLGRYLGHCDGRVVPPREAARRGAGDEADVIIRSY